MPEAPRVLMVENVFLVRDVIGREMALAGFDVLEAADAEQALVLITHFKRLDLLFTVIRLPGTNGWRLAEQIRARYANVPVIYTSGFAEQVPALPRSIVLRKPYFPSEVLHGSAGLGVVPQVQSSH
jgi:CheY-like chemotaxis protein